MPKEYNCTALHCTALVHVVPQQILAKVCCRVPSPGNQGFGRQTPRYGTHSAAHEAPFHKSTGTSAPEGQPSRPCRVHGRNGAEEIWAGKKKSLLWGVLLRGSSTPRPPRCTRGGASGRAVGTLDAQAVQRHVEARP